MGINLTVHATVIAVFQEEDGPYCLVSTTES